MEGSTMLYQLVDGGTVPEATLVSSSNSQPATVAYSHSGEYLAIATAHDISVWQLTDSGAFCRYRQQIAHMAGRTVVVWDSGNVAYTDVVPPPSSPDDDPIWIFELGNDGDPAPESWESAQARIAFLYPDGDRYYIDIGPHLPAERFTAMHASEGGGAVSPFLLAGTSDGRFCVFTDSPRPFFFGFRKDSEGSVSGFATSEDARWFAYSTSRPADKKGDRVRVYALPIQLEDYPGTVALPNDRSRCMHLRFAAGDPRRLVVAWKLYGEKGVEEPSAERLVLADVVTARGEARDVTVVLKSMQDASVAVASPTGWGAAFVEGKTVVVQNVPTAVEVVNASGVWKPRTAVAFPQAPDAECVEGSSTAAVRRELVHARNVVAVAYSEDGRLIATATDVHEVQIWSVWETGPGRVLRAPDSSSFLDGDMGEISLTFSPDRRSLSVATVYGVTIYDLRGWKQILKEHPKNTLQ